MRRACLADDSVLRALGWRHEVAEDVLDFLETSLEEPFQRCLRAADSSLKPLKRSKAIKI